MQALVQALVDVLGVSVARQQGPSALLALLSDVEASAAGGADSAAAHEALFKRAQTTGVQPKPGNHVASSEGARSALARCEALRTVKSSKR